MRTMRAVTVAGLGILLATASLSGHHAFSAEFDIEQPLTLEGKLVKWEMINPHSWFHIDVEAKDGTTSTWLVEGGSPNELIRQGVNRNTVEVGTFLAVEGYRAKDGTEKAVGRNFILENGERLFLGGSANRVSRLASAARVRRPRTGAVLRDGTVSPGGVRRVRPVGRDR